MSQQKNKEKKNQMKISGKNSQNKTFNEWVRSTVKLNVEQ